MRDIPKSMYPIILLLVVGYAAMATNIAADPVKIINEKQGVIEVLNEKIDYMSKDYKKMVTILKRVE